MPVLLRIPGYNPKVAPTDQLRDRALTPAGNLAGSPLPDGIDTSKAWEVLTAGTTWQRTGTAMKPASGSHSAAVAQTGSKLGRASATIASIASSNPTISVVGRAIDADNYLRFGPRTTEGYYQLYRRQGGAFTTLWTSTLAAAVGDVIEIAVPDESTIDLYVNGTKIHSLAAPSALAAINGTKWGMHGAFTTDPTSALRDFKWNPTP